MIGTSAYHDRHRTIDKRELIVDGFIAKPVEREALVRELDRLLISYFDLHGILPSFMIKNQVGVNRLLARGIEGDLRTLHIESKEAQ